jgi:hypothetical protein
MVSEELVHRGFCFYFIGIIHIGIDFTSRSSWLPQQFTSRAGRDGVFWNMSETVQELIGRILSKHFFILPLGFQGSGN